MHAIAGVVLRFHFSHTTRSLEVVSTASLGGPLVAIKGEIYNLWEWELECYAHVLKLLESSDEEECLAHVRSASGSTSQSHSPHQRGP